MQTLALSDMKMLYLVYSVGVTIAACFFTMYMARMLEDPALSVLTRQYLTLFLNALALMTGWAWKSYIQYYVEQTVIEGQIASNYLQALTQTLLACYVYHQICAAAKSAASATEERIIERATNEMD